MIQQPAVSTRISGTVRRAGAQPERPLPDPAEAWKGGRTLIRLVDITVRKHAATAAAAAPPAVPPPMPVAAGNSTPVAAAPLTAETPQRPAATRPTSPTMPARKAVPADSSWQPLIVLGLISLIFAVLAAAIVTGRSNVEPAPDLAPAPVWRAAPGNEAQQAGPTAGREHQELSVEPERDAVEIELPDPALSEAAPALDRDRAPPSIPHYPPVAQFPGHIEPDTMEARHDQSGSSIH